MAATLSSSLRAAKDTDLLIARLSDELRPVPGERGDAEFRSSCILGVSVAALVVSLLLGWRPDFQRAVTTVSFWLKLIFTGWIAVAALYATNRLSIPGRKRAGWAVLLVPPLALLGVVALIELSSDADAATFWLGHTARNCTWRIIALSVPLSVLLLRALARCAPTELREAGLAAGLTAGGLAATVYSLACDENSAGFVLLWYCTGMAVPAAIGWILGPWVLRW